MDQSRPFVARLNQNLPLLVILPALASCVVGPDYHRPAAPQTAYDLTELPAQERVDQPGPRFDTGATPSDWWTLLQCPALDDTERMALAANKSLVAAKATLRQAEQVVLVSRAPYWPQVGLNAGVQRNGAGRFTPTAGGTSSDYFSVGPAATYMADLFGATARAVEQSEAQKQYAHAQLLAADLTVTGAVASQAIALAGARLQISAAEEILAGDRQNLAIVEKLFTVGKAARGDVLAAQSQWVGDEAQLAQLRQQLSVARHALAVLVSRTPADWTPPDFAITDFAPPGYLPTTLPSALVEQRPDIQEAEALLHAASATIGIAAAQLYPSISLSAALTQQSVDASQVFNSVNRVWSLGAGLTAPVFRGGALHAQKRAAIEAFQAQLATYEQTVLVAFGQVADSMRALDHDAELLHDSRDALDISMSSLAVQRATYQAGKTSLVQLLIAEKTYSQARQTFATAQTQQLEDVVRFFLALGGGQPLGVTAAGNT
jgi:NodT family efflux transporter outer membrane factor (OMF) lipoprotein